MEPLGNQLAITLQSYACVLGTSFMCVNVTHHTTVSLDFTLDNVSHEVAWALGSITEFPAVLVYLYLSFIITPLHEWQYQSVVSRRWSRDAKCVMNTKTNSGFSGHLQSCTF